MRLQFTGLWRHPDFLRLWAGQTISVIGSGISFIALPLTAVLVLEATPAQMGLLTAIGALPSLLLGLFAGAWVDRRHRRPIMIVTDIGRAVLLLAVPLLALLNLLRIEYLYLITFLTAIFSLLFGVAYDAFLPQLIGRDHLVEGNSKLALSRSAAEIIGPGLAGALVQLFTAPLAIAIDALTFFASALFLNMIRAPEPPPKPVAQKQTVWRDIGEGLQLIFKDLRLRALAGCVATIGLFNTALEAVWILYITRELEIAPGLLGIIFASGGIGFLVGTLLPERITQRIGMGPAIITGILIASFGDLLTPLAGGPTIVVVTMLIGAQFFFGIGLVIFNVSQTSLRQSLTPDHLLGRIGATMGVVSMAMVPLGGLLGGLLGEIVGLRPTLFIAIAGEALSVIWLVFSPLRSGLVTTHLEHTEAG